VAAVGLFIIAAGTGGCGSSQQPTGAGGSFSASALVTKSYGITQWRTLYGPNWNVVSGHDASGKAVRGIQMSWFASTPTTPGYTRLKMLDGSGATLRRVVGGGESGHLSTEQIAFIQTARSDLMRPGASLGDLSKSQSGLEAEPTRDHLPRLRGLVAGPGQIGVSRAALLGTNPGEGPLCFEARADPQTVVDAMGCMGGLPKLKRPRNVDDAMKDFEILGSCVEWYLDDRQANQICEKENSTSCSGEPPTCNFGQNATPLPPPEPACDRECICANYGIYDGKPCALTCVSSCPAGQTCHWGSCGPPSPKDPLTEDELGVQGRTLSCDEGTALADPETGAISCVRSTESQPPDNAPSYDDFGFSGSLTCVGVSESCGPSDICCVGNCTDGLCPNMDFNIDLPACKFSGDPCTDTWECCGGGEVCLGTCTSGGADTCSNDSCAVDDDCCSKDCDEDKLKCVL